MSGDSKISDLPDGTATSGTEIVPVVQGGNTVRRLINQLLAPSWGASAVGASDGSSGSLWTTVQGFINKILSSAGASVVGFIQSGTGAVARWVQDKLRERISVFDFMTSAQIADVQAGTATLDVAAAVQAAITAAGSNKKIFFPAGTYKIGSPFVLAAAATGIKLQGDGVSTTTIKKAFNGDLFTLNSATYFGLSDTKVDGQYGTYTGRCVVLTGTSHFPNFVNLETQGFSGNHIDFAADAGFGANIINHQARLGGAQTSCTGVAVSGNDTGYTVRRIVSCNYSGPIDMSGGCNDVYISDTQFTTVITSALCAHLFIHGCRWGNAGAAITIYGDTFVVGCSFAESVTLDASFDGAFIGNHQDGGSAPYFTNNSSGCLVHHFDPSGIFYVNKSTLSYAKVGEIETNSVNNLGDVNYTYVVDSSPAVIDFNTSLTTNRTVTLPTTASVRLGTKLRVVRHGGDTGGPWTITVGATGKTLLANTWCDVIYNGSYWQVTAYGSVTSYTSVGTFTCAAAATTTVANTNVLSASSKIMLMPTNAAAATLMGAATHLYVSAKTANTSFAVTTANGVAAAGTETFDYIIVN